MKRGTAVVTKCQMVRVTLAVLVRVGEGVGPDGGVPVSVSAAVRDGVEVGEGVAVGEMTGVSVGVGVSNVEGSGGV